MSEKEDTEQALLLLYDDVKVGIDLLILERPLSPSGNRRLTANG